MCQLMFAAFPLHANQIDTTIIADGGPGPYVLGNSFIDTSSITITFLRNAGNGRNPISDTIDRPVPEYMFVNNINALMFSEPIERGTKMVVRFTVLHTGFPRIYSLFEKRYAAANDTLVMVRDSLLRVPQNRFSEENLTLSGYKSINVSMGTMGNVNLEQSLDVTLSGEIAPHTTLAGHLTDQGTSLEGTREISDLDRIYVELVNPRYTCSVGDQYMYWPVSNGLVQGQKKLKGLSFGYNPNLFGTIGTVKVFGAVSAGSFTIQNIKGKGGMQGPYYCTGNGEKAFIMPLRGTVSVSVNGQKLTEGVQQDYTVDYDAGTITFMPKILIKEDDLIKFEYEYKLYDYQRTLVGAHVNEALRDSSVTVDGGLWYESDDKNRPIDLILSPEDIDRMSHANDTVAPMHSSAREVDPKEVAWQTDVYPLYKKDNNGKWAFVKFNKDSANNNAGYFTVWFAEKGSNQGDYSLDQNLMAQYPKLGKIYSYVGAGNGTASDSTPIPLPQSNAIGEIKTRISPQKWVSAQIDLAGMEHDQNLFSTIGDHRNSGFASDVSFLLGIKNPEKRSLWVSGKNFYVTPKYTREAIDVSEANQRWDDTTSNMRGGLRHSWETQGGLTIVPGLTTEASYGQFRHDNILVTDRIDFDAVFSRQQSLSLRYNGSLFRHLASQDNTRRDDLIFDKKLGRSDLVFNVGDEWRSYETGGNRGDEKSGVAVSFAPLGLKESVSLMLHKKGSDGIVTASDTGRTVVWEQSFNRSINRYWNVDATAKYMDLDVYNLVRQSTFLAAAQSDVSLVEKGFSSHQDYRVTIEQGSSFETVGIYTQPGQGNAVWSDSLGKYVLKPNGDYVLTQKEVYDSTSQQRQRKTRLCVNWSYWPQKKTLSGLFRDLSWYGALLCEENISLDYNQPASSWIPGYRSVFSNEKLQDPSIVLSDCSYRQNIDWTPDSMKGLHGRVFVEPDVKKQSTYSETGVSWGGSIDKSVDPWFYSVEGTVFNAWWSNVSTSYDLADRYGVATEKYNIFHPLTVYLKETAGWAGKTGSDASDGDKGWYYRAVPGLQWQISNSGSAEASYTYSYVGLENIVDPRLAQGFSPGLTHSFDVSAHIGFNTHFSFDLTYHGEIGKTYFNANGLHVLSMQMKAYL